MATRMQRYKQSGSASSRSQRNKELYHDIYEYGEYSNIEGIASLGNTNEIDITKIKELINNRENYQKRREFHKTIEMQRPVLPEMEEPEEEELEERNYDIRDILVKAKESMPKDDKERVLRDSKYEFLNRVQKERESTPEEEDLKELINTITATSMLNKVGDATLAKDLFSDLAADENEKEEPKSLKEYIKETSTVQTNNLENSLDKSFFTSSLNLSKSDFIDSEEKEKKTSVFSIIVIILLVLIIIGCAGILVYKRLM